MMFLKKCPPSIYTFTNLLSIKSTGQEVVKIYNQVAKTMPLTLPFINQCISILGVKFNLVEDAIAIFDKIPGCRLYPRMSSLNIVLHSLSKSNQVIDMTSSSIYTSSKDLKVRHASKRNNNMQKITILKDGEERGQGNDLPNSGKAFHEPSVTEPKNNNRTTGERYPPLAELLQSFTGLQAAFQLLNLMYASKFGKDIYPDSYSINTILECILSEENEEVTDRNRMSTYLFMQALKKKVEPNAVVCSTYLRSFRNDLEGASSAYRNIIRPYLIKQQDKLQNRNIRRKRYLDNGNIEVNQVKTERISVKSIYNLNVAAGGLLYVCGRALRPDTALQIVYSLQRDEEEGTTNLYRFYQKGKAESMTEIGRGDKANYKSILNDYLFQKPYEEVLKRECNADVQYWKKILPVNKVRIKI